VRTEVTLDTIDNRIREAYRKIISKKVRPTGFGGLKLSTSWVGLADLRDELHDIPRPQLDAALRRMMDIDYPHPGFPYIAPEEASRFVSKRDRSASIIIGGEANHVIMFADPSPIPTRKR
jgi:hypothetical protein